MKIWFFGAETSNSEFLIIVRLCVALMVISVLPDSAFAQGPIEVLEEFMISSVDDWGFQAISGDIVVYDTNGDIYGYDLSTHTGFSIAHHGSSQFPAISGDTIVWMDQSSGHWDIYGYDLGEDCEFQVTSHAADQKWPVTDGNTVVWVDWRNGGEPLYGYDLYGYDLASGTEFRISGRSVPIGPCIAISGNVVVWSDRRYGGWDVSGYDLSSHTEIQISHWWALSPYCPAISNGVIVLGEGNSVIGIDLSGNLLFETATLTPLRIPSCPGIDGNLVIWQEGPAPMVICPDPPCPSDIVGYDINSDDTFLIAGDGHRANNPAISSGVIVWRELGSLNSPYPPGVYVSKLLETVRLSVSSQFVDPGDVLTYTIALAEATPTGSYKNITASLSSFTTLDVFSLLATSGNYGYDPATHVITWTGDVSSSNPVTITYNATVSLDASLGEHITNTVIISDQTSIFTRTASTWVARRTYLPLIMHSVNP